MLIVAKFMYKIDYYLIKKLNAIAKPLGLNLVDNDGPFSISISK